MEHNPLLTARSRREVEEYVRLGYPIDGEGLDEYRINIVWQENSPLAQAIFRHDIEVTAALLEQGANPNISLLIGARRNVMKPLEFAIKLLSSRDMVRLLINAGASLEWNLFQSVVELAFIVGSKDLVTFFLFELDLPFNPRFVLRAIEPDNLELIDYLLSDEFPFDFDINMDEGSPLLHAVRTKDLAIVDRFLLAGANPRIYSSSSAFSLACSMGNEEIVDRLLDYAPDIAEYRDIRTRRTAAFEVLESQNLRLIEKIVRLCDIRALDSDGKSIFHSGVSLFTQDHDFYQQVLPLLMTVADEQEPGLGLILLNLPDNQGETPIVQNENRYYSPMILNELLRMGGNFRIRIANGKTVFHIAIETFSLTEESLRFLLEVYPEGASLPDNRGITPLNRIRTIYPHLAALLAP